MEVILLLMFDFLLFIVYSISIFLIAILIQLISYKVFKFNLYKWINKILFK